MATDTPLAQQAKEARRRFKTLEGLAGRSWINASAWTRQEARLVMHLNAAADLGVAVSDEPPTKRADAFVYWAARRLSEPATEAVAALLDGIAAGGPSADGARDALHLMPPADDTAIAGTQRWEEPTVRLAFLEAAAQAKTSISSGVFNRALDQDPETQAAAVKAAGVDDGTPASTFRDWFIPTSPSAALPAQTAAAFAGLVRGDDQAHDALPRLLERVDDPEPYYTVLRLMALTGGAAYRESLVAYSETEPAAAAYLLGVHGHPSNLDTLVALLERPEAAEEAAAAWWRVTGVTLPRRPRLQSADDSDEAGRGEIPDAEWAAGWLESNRNHLPQADQLLFGRVMDARSLASGCRLWAGTASLDLAHQAQLIVGPSPALGTAPWLHQRLARLDDAGLHDDVTIPPEFETADPWERGHYA